MTSPLGNASTASGCCSIAFVPEPSRSPKRNRLSENNGSPPTCACTAMPFMMTHMRALAESNSDKTYFYIGRRILFPVGISSEVPLTCTELPTKPKLES